MIRAARRLLASIALVASLATPDAAMSAPPAQPSLSVSPAITELQGQPPIGLPSLVVHNTTGRTLRVRAYPVLVSQALDGGLVPKLERPARARAGRTFRVWPPSFVLAPGATIQLTERWMRRPAQSWGSWAAILIDAVPTGRHPRIRLRLLQALLMTIPTAPRPSARIVSLDRRPNAKRTLAFAVRVANTGKVHAWVTTASVALRRIGARGVVLLTTPLPRVVLPHATRQVPLTAIKRLSPGRYRALVTIRVGTTTTQRTFIVTIRPHARPTAT